MSDALLQVENLKKYFMVPDGMLHAVDDVSFTLDIGETLGVVGESGCGKSTLGKTILQLIRPTSGKIVFDGEDISKVDNKKFVELRPKMQMIFQDPLSSLNPRMSVSQQIAEPLLIHKVCPDKESLDKRVLELMDTVGLARRYVDTYPHELDGGRRQRIGIARALALEPKMIICDEPVSALDVLIQAQILNLLQDLQKEKGMAYMFITHDLSVVKHISDHISVMYLGQMIEKAPTAELFSHTWHPYTKALLSAIPIPSIKNKKKRELLKGELTSPINPPDACRFAPRCNYACEECFKGTPKLEELSKDHFVACKRVRELNGL
ncbi:MAG: ATP-binding cassette domain-containing protein [Firmicutes bacterium]|nr:ATP-binding cassette domain-containing protein [Bacillota bacterium]MBR6236760.1 ATP-binding cassette domain-containing protein [Bacillota bacterium]